METPDDDPAGDGHPPEPAPGYDGNDRLLSKHEVAALLGGNVTPRTVIRCWRKWGLRAVKVGRVRSFPESDVLAYIKRQMLGD